MGEQRIRKGVERLREPAGEPLPRPIALTHVHRGVGRAAAVRAARTEGRRHIPAVGIVLIDRQPPGVETLEPIVGRLPALACVQAPCGTIARGLVGATPHGGVRRERVHVAPGPLPVVCPARAPIRAQHEPAELDAHQQAPRVVRARGYPAYVRRPRSRGIAPSRRGGDVAQRFELDPAAAAVLAAVEHARLAPRVHRAVDRADRDREHVRGRQSRILPAGSAVRGPPDAGAAAASVGRPWPSRVRGEALGAAAGKAYRRVPVRAATLDPHEVVAGRYEQRGHGLIPVHPSGLGPPIEA